MERNQNTTNKNTVSNPGRTTITVDSKRIKVTVHIPENMNETSRQQKINRIYDILKPRVSG